MQRGVMLAIETSNPSAFEGAGAAPGVALVRFEGEEIVVLGRADIDPSRTHEDMLCAKIAEAAERAGVSAQQIGHVAVSAGPGGFTSVRIAVTTAKMIAEATGAACYAVPTAEVVARRAARDGRNFAVVLASKRDSAFVAWFDAFGGLLAPGAIVDARGALAHGAARLIADRFVPESFVALARERGVVIERPVFDAAAVAEVARGLSPVDPSALLPIYPREPEAVTKWKAQRGNV